MDTNTLILIIIGIFALIVIIAVIRYKQQGGAEIKGPFGLSLKIEGSNKEENPQQRGIRAKDVLSREGGIKVQEAEGHGVDVEKLDARSDVSISSGSTDALSRETREAGLSLAAAGLSAGGNITIQQYVGGNVPLTEQLAFFVREIGLSRNTMYKEAEFKAYSDVWKILQKLRLASDDLWQRATKERLLTFGKHFRDAQQLVYEGEIYFSQRDRNDLKQVLQHLGDFYVGKSNLVNIRDEYAYERFKESVKREYEYGERRITEQIRRNHKAKRQYEVVLNNIRDSFHERLSS